VILLIKINSYNYSGYVTGKFCTDGIPGGFLPSLTVLCQAISGHTQFIVEHLENIGVNYARTLREWRFRFISQTDQIASMGFDKAFIRKWKYYLSCCEAGFERRVLGDIQMVLRRAKNESEDG